jgi:hypothetical protein
LLLNDLISDDLSALFESALKRSRNSSIASERTGRVRWLDFAERFRDRERTTPASRDHFLEPRSDAEVILHRRECVARNEGACSVLVLLERDCRDFGHLVVESDEVTHYLLAFDCLRI